MEKDLIQKQHYLWGDITKGIAITFVVAGHSYFPKNVTDFIYLFHMPIFFLLAGYFFNFSKYSNNFTLLIKSSAKRLLLPAFLWKIFFFNITNRNFLNNLFFLLYQYFHLSKNIKQIKLFRFSVNNFFCRCQTRFQIRTCY